MALRNRVQTNEVDELNTPSGSSLICSKALDYASNGETLRSGWLFEEGLNKELAVGCRPLGWAPAHNVKALRTQEMTIAEQADQAYERFVSQWRPRGRGRGFRERLKPARHK
jgi:hypothetical protein